MNTAELQQKLQEEYDQNLCGESTEGHSFEFGYGNTFAYSFWICSKCGFDKGLISFQVSSTDTYDFRLNDTSVINFNDAVDVV